MSTIARRVFTGLKRAAFSRGISVHNAAPTVGLNSVRPLSAESKDGDQVNNEPIKFSTSKASHRTWKVDRSMGSQFQRPLWKVVPISLIVTSFLLWCALRGESDIDSQLEKQLYEHLPSLLSEEEEEEEEEEEAQNKSS